jgi:hypothetical protein
MTATAHESAARLVQLYLQALRQSVRDPESAIAAHYLAQALDRRRCSATECALVHEPLAA